MRTIRYQRQGRCGRRGAAAVEMALVLPLLLLLLLGACDFGRFAHTQIAVSNAARAGAGQACRNRPTPTTQPQWEAAIRRVVTSEMEGLAGFRANELTVTIATVVETSGTQRASIEVRYPFRTLITWNGLPALLTFRETVVFRFLHT